MLSPDSFITKSSATLPLLNHLIIFTKYVGKKHQRIQFCGVISALIVMASRIRFINIPTNASKLGANFCID